MIQLLLYTLGAGLALAATPTGHTLTVNGAKLEYLDWGGKGPTMIFLAGFGDRPYIYNDLAPEFTSRFEYLGLTCRGHGKSERTATGYTLDELTSDISEFIKTLDFREVTLVGHSYAGLRIMRLAELYPQMIRRAVLLDSAWALQNESISALLNHTVGKLGQKHLAGASPMQSIDNYRKFQRFAHRSWSEAAEANLRQQVDLGVDSKVKMRLPKAVGSQTLSQQKEW